MPLPLAKQCTARLLAAIRPALLALILHLYLQFNLRHCLSPACQLKHFHTLGDVIFQARSSAGVEILYASQGTIFIGTASTYTMASFTTTETISMCLN